MDIKYLDLTEVMLQAKPGGGGGLVMYYRRDLTMTSIESHCDQNLEFLTCRLYLKSVKPIYIIGAYRPPDGDLELALETTLV